MPSLVFTVGSVFFHFSLFATNNNFFCFDLPVACSSWRRNAGKRRRVPLRVPDDDTARVVVAIPQVELVGAGFPAGIVDGEALAIVVSPGEDRLCGLLAWVLAEHEARRRGKAQVGQVGQPPPVSLEELTPSPCIRTKGYKKKGVNGRDTHQRWSSLATRCPQWDEAAREPRP